MKRVFLILGLVVLAPGCIDVWVDFLFGYKSFSAVVIPSILFGVILFFVLRAQRLADRAEKS